MKDEDYVALQRKWRREDRRRGWAIVLACVVVAAFWAWLIGRALE